MVEIVKSSYEKSIQFEVDFKKEQELHIHENLEILFVLTGTVSVEMNSNIVTLQAEDFLVINEYEVHQILFDDDAHTLSLLLGQDITGRKFLPVACTSVNAENDDEIQLLKKDFAGMFRMFYKDCENNREDIFSYGYRILGTLQNYFVDGEYSKLPQTKSLGRIDDILRYINENYQQALTLKSVADKFYISAGHLSRLFRLLIKMSFHQYVREVRLHHAYLALKTEENCSVTQIAYDCGFSTTNQMIDAFRQKYGITPGKMKKEFQHKNRTVEKRNLNMFRSLMKYVEVEEDLEQSASEVINIAADVKNEGVPFGNHIFELFNIGWAKDMLMEPIRSQIRLCQEKIGFRYLRCHGIFDDDMMVYQENEYGEAIYNFNYINQIYDFLLSIGIYPYVELSFTPSHLAGNKKEWWFWKHSYFCMPNSMEKWVALVKKFLDNCIRRYGIDCVRKWKFTIMQGMGAYFKAFTLKEHCQLYKETYRAVKDVDPFLLFGGPGTELSTYHGEGKMKELQLILDFYKKNDCVPDFLCFELFHVVYDFNADKARFLVISHALEPLPIVEDPDFCREITGELKDFLSENQMGEIPIFLECWNSTIWQRDLCNDTCYKSAFLFKNLLENNHSYSAMGYWTMSDMMEEVFPSNQLFHGGYGILTSNGIPKSGFSAYMLLRKLGSHVLKKGDGFVVTKDEDHRISIALYNYCHYDSLSRQNFYTEGSNTSRYKCFQSGNIHNYQISLGLEDGFYHVEYYSISRKRRGGSVYDNWVSIGAPDELNKEQIDYLKQISGPYYDYKKEKTKKGVLNLNIQVEPHEVYMIVVSRA